MAHDWASLQMEFNVYTGSVKDFAEEKGLSYAMARQRLKIKDKNAFRNEVMSAARDQLVVSLADETAKRFERWWKLTEIIEGQILERLQNDKPEAKSLEQLLRVMQENVRLQHILTGSPDPNAAEGPKSPFEAFMNKQRAEDGEVLDG